MPSIAILTFVHFCECLWTSPWGGTFCRCAGPTPLRIVCNSGSGALFQVGPRQCFLWFPCRTQKGSECWKTRICEAQSSHMYSDYNKSINSCNKGEEQGFWISNNEQTPTFLDDGLNLHWVNVCDQFACDTLHFDFINWGQTNSSPLRFLAPSHMPPQKSTGSRAAFTHCNRSCL